MITKSPDGKLRGDAIDQFLFALHQMLGHDKTAAFIGMPVGDKTRCILCHPEMIRSAEGI